MVQLSIKAKKDDHATHKPNMQMDIYMSWLQQPSTYLHNLVPPMNAAI